MRGRSQLLDLLRRWDARPEAIPHAELLEGLKGLDLDRTDLAEALVFDDRAYRRVAVWRRPHYEALVLCWRSGQGSPIHDHAGSSCAVRVVEGRATETRYAPSPCGRLVPRRSLAHPAGVVLGCRGDCIHQMANLEPAGHDLITLHVYSPPPAGWRDYPLDQTTLAGHDRLIRDRPRTLVVDLGHAVPGGPAGATPRLRSGLPMETTGSSNPVAVADVAIVGGGFSGALVAVHLARRAGPSPLRVVLFERGDRFARGLAYGTRCDAHLLNVPAGSMSALPDEPSHFLDWLRARDPDALPGTFAPRRLYGDYLEDLLTATARQSPARVDLVRDEVVDLEVVERPGAVRLTTRRGERLTAGRVVLALGHRPPQEPAGWDGPVPSCGYIADPWAPGALAGLSADDPIAVIGTGLTAVDLIVEARANGHRGTIHAISRHGLLPCRHPASPAPPRPHFAVPGPGAPPTARALLRRVRSEAVTCQVEGGDWRSVVDALRPVTQTLWRSLGDGERRRFIRHVAPRWEVHRHRVAPAVDDAISAARRSGQLDVIAGRVVALRGQGGQIAVTLRRRGATTTETETLFVRRVINCTGPARDVRVGPSALLQSVLARGVGRPGPLALGLDVTDSGALVRRDGRAHTRLFAIGPLLKERLWETTAVRELRVQALDLARKLLSGPGK
jgi:uncharacterized NAD(P)/FAD-binding protein YdhS